MRGEDWSPPGKETLEFRQDIHLVEIPRKLYTDDRSNDVNGAVLQQTSRTASGRNGSDHKAIHVVNPRNPCGGRGQQQHGRVFSAKKTTYVGTWNVRTLHAAGQLDILLYEV